ncbi:MAG: lytic transglycosylase domain-containing protein [Deltaproteobacteria bacterium]|nr:lytic transglycosylase domain-containing protein [Deltaproteobacteria bacterium]
MVDAFTLARTARAERLYEPIVIDAAQNYDVQPSLIKAVIMAESTFDHRAVSHRGAQGLMQLMPGTAKDLGVEDSFNPAHNIFGGVKYLKQLIERFEGNAELALAAYNAGLQKVLMYKGVPPFQSTRAYIKKVQQYQKYYQWKMAGRIEQA